MAGMKATVYIKGGRNVEVTKPDVTLGDIVQMECGNTAILPKLKTMRLLKFQTDAKNKSGGQEKISRHVVSILRIIELIHREYPEVEVQNMGEPDIIVTYELQKNAGKATHVLKAACVVLISFAGAAFSIMAFNNDVDVTTLFGQIYQQTTGRESSGFTVLELTYCLGLIIGILVFFNHFGRKRFSVDPTPMEVEMRTYENDIQTTLIENCSRKGKELDVGTADTTGDHRP